MPYRLVNGNRHLREAHFLHNYWLSIVEFWVRSKNCEKRILASSCLSVRMEQFGSIWADFQEML